MSHPARDCWSYKTSIVFTVTGIAASEMELET
jgi:hypothetical protein